MEKAKIEKTKKEKVKIVFQNGMEMEAEENGSSLITESRPDFPADLSSVTVIGSGGEHIYKNAEIVECASVDYRYWFTFREIPESERIARQMPPFIFRGTCPNTERKTANFAKK